MAQFIAFDLKVEVNGQTVLSVINGVSDSYKERIYNILARFQILDPQPNTWYNQQNWLDAFKEIAENIGKFTLFSIGKSIPTSADFPKEIDKLEKALKSINLAYQMNHRGGEIGYYRLLEFDDTKRRAVMECKNPYPCHFDRGIITAMVRRFRPIESLVQDVVVDESRPQRLLGDDSSTYLITW